MQATESTLFLDEFVKDHAARAWRLAYCLTRNVHDADDIVQQAFVVTVSRIDALPRDRAWPWLAAVIANQVRHRWRASARPTHEELVEMHEDPRAVDPACAATHNEEMEALAHAVGELPSQEREAIALVHLSGMTIRDAASAAGVPRSTMADRLSIAMEKLKQNIKREETAVAGGLAAFAVPLPPGGIEAATNSWLSSAKAIGTLSISGQAASISSIAAGGFAMKKLLLLLGFALVAGVSVTTGVIIGKETSSPTTEEQPSPIVADSNRDRTARTILATSAPGGTSAVDERTVLLAQVTTLETQVRAAEVGLRDRDSKVAELNAELVVTRDALHSLQSTASASTTVPETRISAARLKAAELLNDLDAAIQAGDKAKALEILHAVAELGIDVYPEFYTAYDRLQKVGNPYGGTNSLGLSAFEFISLIPTEFVTFAIKDPHGDVPATAMTHAFYAAPWLGGVSAKERTAAVIRVLETRAEPYLLVAALEAVKSPTDAPDLIPALAKIIVNSTVEPQVRTKALQTMLMFKRSEIDWTVLDSLKNERDPDMLKACAAANVMRSNAIVGFLVTSIDTGSPAADAGLYVGDVITRYGEKDVSDQASFQEAVAGIKVGELINVSVFRNGGAVVLVLVSSLYPGITGTGVWKIE